MQVYKLNKSSNISNESLNKILRKFWTRESLEISAISMQQVLTLVDRTKGRIVFKEVSYELGILSKKVNHT